MQDRNIMNGRKCLVTGASRGIGRAIALMLAEYGAQVVIHYNKDQHAAEMLMNQLPGAGHTLVQADLSDAVALVDLFEKMKNDRLDLLVNNAGVYMEKPMTEMDFNEWQQVWDQTLALNLTGPAHLSYLFSEMMIRQGGGRIINITSRGAFRGEPNALAYGASKAGLNSFGQSLAKTLAPHNVLVFTIAPGFVETDMARYALEGPHGADIKAQSPLNRAAQPEEIAGIVAWLASEAPEYLTGCIIDANGASYLRN